MPRFNLILEGNIGKIFLIGLLYFGNIIGSILFLNKFRASPAL